jgi:hypothetical protein
MQRHSGQALIEVLISASWILILFTGAGWVLQVAWEKGRCAALVFESTHGILSGEPRLGASLPGAGARGFQFSISESDSAVMGEGRCGDRMPSPERVGFRKLESLREWP